MSLMDMLEAKNAFMLMLNGSIAAAFIRMLISDRHSWGEPYYGAMVGVAVYFTASALDQSWYWAWRHFGHSDRALLVAFDTFMVVGAACLLRNFTVARFGHALWISILAVSAAAAVALTVLLPRGVEEIADFFM